MRNKRVVISILSMLLVAALTTGCVDVQPTVSQSSVSTENETTVSTVNEPEVSQERSGCNHRYNFGVQFWDDPFESCKKCGYSPARAEDHDCESQGHIVIIYFNETCSICRQEVEYSYSDLVPVDYKAPTEECDGIARFTDKGGKNIYLDYVPAGHGHENNQDGFHYGRYDLVDVKYDICFEGIISQLKCRYCHENIDEPFVRVNGNGYHYSPKIITPADPEDPSSTAHILCEVCGKEYDCPLPPRLVLSGRREDIVTTTEYCYIKGDGYVILLDKDIKLHGDFENIVANAINEIRKQTGLLTDNWDPNKRDVFPYKFITEDGDCWDAIPDNGEIFINMVVDREAVGYISSAGQSYVRITEYDFYGDDLWNSVPDYRDNPWRRNEQEPDYGVLFHELTHAITLRTLTSCEMGKIVTEGIADYIEKRVDDEFRKSIEGYVPSYNATYDQTKLAITPENAEELFIHDYCDLSHADRGAEYDFGKYLFTFLEDEYGSDYFVKICKELQGTGGDDRWREATEQERINRADAFKKIFGDDVFVKFGKWYQNK